MPTSPVLAREVLARTSYVLLTTFRKSGAAVATPVWIAPGRGDLAGALLVWSNPRAGKIKRLRRPSDVLVQPCSIGGTPIGEPITARAERLPDDRVQDVIRALVRKYGITAWLTTLSTRQWPGPLARLPRRAAAGIAIHLP
ncbi:PPOX class F420-dependent oxidoreductase [Nakamurella leprariae]|uniref:PPOX class F420-dependent oxidoreductase n=1 Tax=Nakamurella leprariae TaxID=2803911 RepID=A0A938Y9P5_9ACTN|nr:PPOX class F420-dependent oxidoreductase [Nakamurella leprariae]MBM9465754.1 PPOX class F420-dependent oxidoreductase [Nakamurella leprariae]